MDGIKILIVEDNAELLDYMSDVVETHGTDLGLQFEVLKAQDGLDGFLILREKRVDLIITDLNMPFMNGQGLVKALHEKDNPNKKTPKIIVSGSIDDFKDEATDDLYFVERPFCVERFGKLISLRLRLLKSAG